jgi:subtilase family serine protease
LGAGNNGVPFNANLTIKNNGTAPAGSFTVKIYFSGWGTLNKYAILLQTWNVAGLAAGQSLSHTFSDLVFTGAGIHTTYYIHCKVDANNQIVESNEKNNLAPPVEVFVYR